MKIIDITEADESPKRQNVTPQDPQARVKTKTYSNPFGATAFHPKTDQLPAQVRQQQMRKMQQAVSQADTTNMPAINLDQLPAENDLDLGNPEPEDRPPGTEVALPIGTGVLGAGDQAPDWYKVDQLPGMMQSGIRQMGRTVFGSFTSTPLEDINILVNLGGQGPHEDIELNAVAGNARDHAVETSDLSMEFGEAIPGYSPDVKLYDTGEYTYMVVQDDMGKYIYSWDSNDNIKQGEIAPPPKRARLGYD